MPTDSWRRQNSRFKAGWQQTLDLLERELNHLRAKDITIEGFFALNDIRNDGWPKSSARPTQPGVILSFASKQGPIVMPCDNFKDWESNLRAIALTLEHLRSVEFTDPKACRQRGRTWSLARQSRLTPPLRGLRSFLAFAAPFPVRDWA